MIAVLGEERALTGVFCSFRSHLVICLAGRFMDRRNAGGLCEPFDNDITVAGIKLDAIAMPSGFLRRDQGGTAAGEGIEHNAVPF